MKSPLNPNEWIVMNALWQRSPLTLSEAIAAIGDKASWNYKTYQSYMGVLEKKGYVGSEKRGRDKFYYPIVSKQSCIEQESRSILEKMQADSVAMLVANMVQEGNLGTEEYRELMAMLEQLLAKEEANG